MLATGRLLLILLLLLGATSAYAYDQPSLIALACAAVQAEVKGEAPPKSRTKTPAKPVFVTIEIKGRVVGCRGGLEARTRSLEEEVVTAARSAARHDPRYRPLTRKDLASFQVTVTIVERLDPITSVDSLTPADGLVLKSGGKTGVVLPWEGKDPKVRLAWAYKKANVKQGAMCKLYRLKAERFRG